MAIFTAISAAITAIAGWTVTIGSLGTFAIGNFLLRTAVQLGVSALTAALAGKPKAEAFSIKGSVRTGGAVPRSFMLGPSLTAGSLVWHSEWGEDGGTPNAFYTQVIALSDLPVSGLRRWFLQGGAVTLEDTGDERGLAAVEYREGGKDHAWVRFHDGNQTEADAFLVGAVSRGGERVYSPSRVGWGVAYAVVTFRVHQEIFTGFPTSKFVVDGVPLYDASKDTTNGGTGAHRWDDRATWGGDGDALPAVQAYNLARGLYYAAPAVSGAASDDASIAIGEGVSTISLEIIGGGGGGLVSDQSGGDTVVTLKDGATVIQTWTASGGAARSAGTAGGASPRAPYGAGAPGRAERRQEGGRGEGEVQVSGVAGGAAGALVSVVDFDVSGLSDPILEVSAGAPAPGAGFGGVAFTGALASARKPDWFYGLQGLTAARLPAVHWITQIEKCRAQIEGEDGLEPIYRSAGEITVNSEIGSAFEAILTACAGRMSEVGGIFKVYVGGPDAPIAHFDDEDIVSLAPQSFTPFYGLSDTINGVIGSYPSPDEGYVMRSTPPIYNAAYEVEDGGRRLMADVELGFVPFPAQAQRLLAGELAAARRARRHTFTLPARFRKVEPGDVVTWTSPRNGYEGKSFRVDGIIDLPNCDLIVDITEVDASDHGNWQHSTDYTPVTPAPLLSVRPMAQAVAGFGVVAKDITDEAGGSRRPGILLTWDASVDGIAGLVFEVRATVTGELVAFFETSDFAAAEYPISAGLLPATEYEVRAKYIPADPRAVAWSYPHYVLTNDVRLGSADLEAVLDARITAAFDGVAGLTDDLNDLTNGFVWPDLATAFGEVRDDLTLQEINQVEISGAVSAVHENVLWALEKFSTTQSTLSDAGVYVDPESGSVRIAGVDQQADRVSEAEIRLDAAEASISLRATTAYVDQTIAQAVIDPSQIPVFGQLDARINDVSIDLDAAEAAIELKADQTTVSGYGVRLGQAEVDINALEGSIELKVDRADFTPVETRLQAAEVELDLLDGASIRQGVSDVRSIHDALDLSSVDSLASLLANYEARGDLAREVAYARQDLQAKIADEGEAVARIAQQLGAAIDGNVALLEAEKTVRASENAASAEVINQLDVRLAGAEGGLEAQADAFNGLQTEVSEIDGKLTSTSQEVTQLSAALEVAGSGISGNTSKIAAQADAFSGLQTEVSEIDGRLTSTSQDVTQLNASLGEVDEAVSGNASALNSLSARVGQTEGGVAAQAVQISSLRTSVDGHSSEISQAFSSINGVRAEYTLRINNNGFVSGMVLRSDIDNTGKAATSVAFASDKFAIASPSGSQAETPFAVYTTSQNIGGVIVPPGVYIKDANIRKAGIQSAHIAKAAIGRAEVSDVIESDNYAQDSKGVPTSGLRLNFKTGEVKSANIVMSRQMVLASGTFSPGGTARDGSEYLWVNTGVEIGRDDVWSTSEVSLVASAALLGTGTADGGISGNDEFWSCEAEVMQGARWNGGGTGASISYRNDPPHVFKPYWASGGGQRLRLRVKVRAAGVWFSNPTIAWKVFQVT